MLRKFVALGLVGLFLAMSLVVAEDSIGPYNPIADINKDGIVDILDLVEVGQAYGSSYTLMTKPNRTVVTVLNFAQSPPEVEGALVALSVYDGGQGCLDAELTNSSGVAVFTLSSNSGYRAYAWKDEACNYVDFSTNSHGEASVLIILGEPPNLKTHRLPEPWAFFVFKDNATGVYLVDRQYVEVYIYAMELDNDGWPIWRLVFDEFGYSPVFAFRDDISNYELAPDTTYLLRVEDPIDYRFIGWGAFQTDSNRNAVATVYGNFSTWG